MHRRRLIALLGGAIALPCVAAEQQKAMPVIGFLGTSSENAGFLHPFREGLSEIGYVEGDNVAMEYRVAYFHYDQFPALVAELIRRKVDVIVTTNGTTPALAAKNATSTIPIVFTFVSDPVGIGLVASLARPGGNVTGFSNIAVGLAPKQMELISEVVPQVDAIAVLVNPTNPAAELLIRDTQSAAQEKGLKLTVLKASTAEEIDAAFASIVQLQVGALVVDPDGFFNSRRAQLLALASRHAVPTVYPRRQYVAGRRPDQLWGSRNGYPAASRRLHRKDTEGRQASRSASPATDPVRAGRQPEDRPGAGANRPALGPRPRR